MSKRHIDYQIKKMLVIITNHRQLKPETRKHATIIIKEVRHAALSGDSARLVALLAQFARIFLK